MILFSVEDVPCVSDRYGIAGWLPGFQVFGLRGWDDFIVRDLNGSVFTVPTIPCDARHLDQYTRLTDPTRLEQDDRFIGKIKWYIKPIIFGGDPAIGDNVTWVTYEQHAQLVRWWNDKYRSINGESG
jgi:hypothetical protein